MKVFQQREKKLACKFTCFAAGNAIFTCKDMSVSPMEVLYGASYDDYYQWGRSLLLFLKQTIIYFNYTVSLAIMVPYLLLILADIAVYLIRLGVDFAKGLIVRQKVE